MPMTTLKNHRKSETQFFWHIPESGQTALSNICWCTGSTTANDEDGKVTNVDLSSREGILAAKDQELLATEPTFITTQEFKFAAKTLFCHVRPPVDLAAARFYNLQRSSNDRSSSDTCLICRV